MGDTLGVTRWPALLLTWPSGVDRDLIELTLAHLDDFQPTAIQEDDQGPWRVFFASPSSREAAHRELADRLARQGIAISPIDVDDENWAARSQAKLTAVTVGALIIAPPWDLPVQPTPGTIVAIIEPSVGFGTGHHASTRLCLAMCQRLDLRGRRILDVGTGSGVLAIASALLGASAVVAVDIDPDALESARTNAARNEVETTIQFVVADFRSAALHPAEIVFANLTGIMVGAALDRLIDLTTPSGFLVLSGFTADEIVGRPDGPVPSTPRGSLVDRLDEDGWRCLVLQRTLPDA